MKESLLRHAANLKQKNHLHKRWQKVVSVLACMVVFCTVYALVLPAVTMEKTAYCGKEEHAHTEACCEDQLICGKAEGEGSHQHGDQCYKTTQSLICTIPESDGHQHTEECYETTTEDVLICESEDPEHVHGSECYTTVTVTAETPSCGQEVGAGEHHHTEECSETQTTQICGQEELEGHKHTEECYEQVRTCEKEEHTHSLACYSDPNADVEDAGVWQNTVASVSLTGNWGEDLAAVAATQNGYRESEANYAVMEDGATINGYTRYGAWSGDAYRDNWSAQFVNFCLSYAGIPSSAIAQKPECGQWGTTTVAADGSTYIPKKGDLVILDSDHNGAADRAGVVTNASANSFTAVVGDLDKAVKTNTYSIGDSSVTGYVEMPENPALKSENDVDPTPEITPETTPEATPEPEPSEAPEATPTPEPTEAPEVTLVQNTLTAKIYTDSSYETELTDQTSITVSGKLPENASVKAYPIENVTMDGEEILYAWDISIYDAQGNLWEPEDGNPISVEFHVPELAEEEDYSIYYIPESDTEKDPEELQSQVTGNVISFEAEHFSVYALMRAARAGSGTITGTNLSDYITDVIFEKQKGHIWEESTTFEPNDSVRAKITFTGLEKTELQKNDNTTYLELPAGIDCSKFTGTYKTTDGTEESGEYTFQKVDGKWYIVLKLYDDYVNKAGATINGTLNLSYEWSSDLGSAEGKDETITIGKWTGIVNITKKDEGSSGTTSGNYGLSKDASKLSYSPDGKKGYIDYTVKLTVKDKVKGPIKLGDTLSGNISNDWNYVDGSLVINPSTPGISWTIANNATMNNNSATIIIGQEGVEIPAGTYTITYRVENEKISDVNANISQSIHNTISIDTNPSISTDRWTSVNVKDINKQGQLVTGTDGRYIDYTVYINAGDVIKNIENNVQFADKLPSNVEFVDGSIIVKQYGINGNYNDLSSYLTCSNQEIIGSLPKGQYYYIITYRVKVKENDIPIGGTEIINTANSGGGIKGSSESKVSVPNDVLNKEFVEQKVTQENDTWIDKLKWKSTISVDGSVKGYVYEDWSAVGWNGSQPYCQMYMTDQQRNAIVIKDKHGNSVAADKYTVTTSDKKGGYPEIPVGLFKITFTGDVEGPVTIEYETTADLTRYNVGNSIQFKNHASVTYGEYSDEAEATSESIQYTHGNPGIIIKGKYLVNSGVGSTKDTTILEPGQTRIPWAITINRDGTLKCDLTVTDTIADGMIYVPESLKVMRGYYPEITSRVNVSFDETSHELKITIPSTAYVDPSTNEANFVAIYYETELPSDYFEGAEVKKDFKNTASVEANGKTEESTFTQEVTRKVVGKSGKYDALNRLLTYEIVLNPDGSKLNNGNLLTVIDKLDAGGISQYIRLKSLTLFTAKKTKDSSGNVKVEPALRIAQLTENDSKQENTYTWDQDKKQFTAYIKDEQAYVLVAEYFVDVDVASDVALKNEVMIQGQSEWKTEDNTTKVTYQTSGTTNTNHDQVIIIKRDSSNYNTVLAGAEFDLEEYTTTSSSWINKESLITGSNGQVSTVKIERKKLYRLTETKAPNDYVLDAAPYYFIILEKDDIADSYLPNTINNDKNYNKNQVKIVRVTEQDKYAKVVIDRYNTIVKKGELQVEKIWKNSNGQQITDAAELAKMPQIKVTLTKYKHQGNENWSNEGDQEAILSHTNAWTHLWNNLETGDNIRYTLVETTVDGYKKTYVLNSESLSEGTKFSLGESGDIIYITNTEESNDYVLPETGGIGTNRLAAVGLSLMAGSLMCEYVLRRRRRERRRS